jgi:hypothetical protein
MNRRALTLVVGLVSILAVLSVYFGFYGRENKNITKKTEAASGSVTLTSQAEWTAGTNTNTDLATTPGSVKINNKAESEIDIATIFTQDPSRVTTNLHPELLPNLFDSDYSTQWNPYTPDSGDWVIMNLNQSYIASRVLIGRCSATNPSFYTDSVPITCDGSSCTGTNHGLVANFLNSDNSPPGTGIFDLTFSATSFQYFALRPVDDACLDTIRLYTMGYSTHLSAPTQINGGDNFFQWQTFTPTQTVPANTSVSYRFRSSPDASNWTSWSAPQTPTSGNALDISSLVTSKSGDTYYRYLQVETTLSNTDGASTPTVDSYTIGYHTNQKPNKPVAVTAVIGQ